MIQIMGDHELKLDVFIVLFGNTCLNKLLLSWLLSLNSKMKSLNYCVCL